VVAIAQLDFAEAGLLKQLGELANQIGIDLEFSVCHNLSLGVIALTLV